MAAPAEDEKREAAFGDVAVELGRLTPAQLADARRRRDELVRAGQPLRLGELLLAENLLDKNAALEILREARLRLGEPPPVPGYEFHGVLGSGPLGPVFRARQVSLNRFVSFKILPRTFARDPDRLARFNAEAQAAGRLNHPQLVGAFDHGEYAGYHYYTQEYIDGESLYQRQLRDRRFPESAVVALARQIALGLEHLAQSSLVHRAVRPENLMLCRDGNAKIRHLGAGVVQAEDPNPSPYAAPEARIPGLPLDARADQYGLGAVLYEMLSGAPWPPAAMRPPAPGEPAAQLEPPPLHQTVPGLGRGLSAVVQTMLRHRPEERYPDWAAVQADLKLVAENRLPRIAHPAKVFKDEAPPPAAAAVGGGAGRARVMAASRPAQRPKDGLLLMAAAAAFFVLLATFAAQGGFSAPTARPHAFEAPPEGFAEPGLGAAWTTAQAAKTLWRQAQASRRAWEKAGGESPASLKIEGANAAARPKESPEAAEARAAMKDAYTKLAEPPYAALAYGKNARADLTDLGL